MKFINSLRNEYGKCDMPENTKKRIYYGLEKLGIELYWKTAYKISDYIFSASLYSPITRHNVNGKGISPELAEASAYAEFVERFSYWSVWNIPLMDQFLNDNVRRFVNYEWLKGYMKCNQDELESPHMKIEDLLGNEISLRDESIKHIKNIEETKHWVDGYSLVHQRYVKVPIEFISIISSTNGLAAGNTMEEAITQASCEIFERYALINVVKPEKIVPTIDIKSLDNQTVKSMVSFFNKNNVDVIIKDLSFDGLLPCVGVLFVNKNLSRNHMEYRRFSAGASFNFEEALMRCFVERMQGRRNFNPDPDFDKPVVHERINYRFLIERGISEKDMSFLEKGEVKPRPYSKCKDIFEELEKIKDACKKMGTDCVIVDKTHPVLNFPVVRVVIPGMSDVISFFAPLDGSVRQRQLMESFFSNGLNI